MTFTVSGSCTADPISASDSRNRAPRPIVLVTMDTTRADHLSPYGGDVATPTLARIAEHGVVFEKAFAVAPITLPAHTSILSGQYPTRHGVRNNGIHFVGGGVPLLQKPFTPTKLAEMVRLALDAPTRLT